MSSALKMLHAAMLFCNTSLRGVGVYADTVEAFSLLNHAHAPFSIGFPDQNVREECGDFDSRTIPAACSAVKNTSISLLAPRAAAIEA